MGGFHGRRRQLDATANFITEPSRDVPAYQYGDGFTNTLFLQALSHICELRVKALGIANGKLDHLVCCQADQFIRFLKRERQWFFQEHMLLGVEAILGYWKVC